MRVDVVVQIPHCDTRVAQEGMERLMDTGPCFLPCACGEGADNVVAVVWGEDLVCLGRDHNDLAWRLRDEHVSPTSVRVPEACLLFDSHIAAVIVFKV